MEVIVASRCILPTVKLHTILVGSISVESVNYNVTFRRELALVLITKAR